MTWTKFGTEFFDDCAEAGLSDAAVRTHAEAIGWIYSQENTSCLIKNSTMHRWAGSPDYREAITTELIPAGWWIPQGQDFEVRHHGDVIRQSLAAQIKKRTTERNRQRDKRNQEAPKITADASGTNIAPLLLLVTTTRPTPNTKGTP